MGIAIQKSFTALKILLFLISVRFCAVAASQQDICNISGNFGPTQGHLVFPAASSVLFQSSTLPLRHARPLAHRLVPTLELAEEEEERKTERKILAICWLQSFELGRHDHVLLDSYQISMTLFASLVYYGEKTGCPSPEDFSSAGVYEESYACYQIEN